jgi:integrase/recombinase XerD
MKELLESFLNHLKLKKKSENTITNYRYDLIPFVKYIDAHNINVKEIKVLHIENYLATINCKETSMNRYISSLQSFFKYLHNTLEVVDDNPAYKLVRPIIPQRQPIFMDESEAKRLLKSVTGEYKERNYAILTIFLNCCLRLSELISININKMDFENQTVTVIGKGNKEREVDLTPACITAINNYLNVRPNIDGETALFLSERKQRINKSTIQKLLKKYLGIAGLDNEEYHVHTLRHTGATLIYKASKDIVGLQEILGHENLSTTKIYTHIDKEHRKSVANSNPLSNIV